MINHYLGSVLIREPHSILLAEAEAARQPGSARPRRPRADATVAPRPRLYQTPRWLCPARSQLPGLRARSASAGAQIALGDGSHVLVRQVQSADVPLLADGFARLSAASRWMRFLTPKKGLSPAELSYFTDPDPDPDHEALGALAQNVVVAGLLRNACASLVRRDSNTREYEIALVPSEEQDRPAGLELLSLPAGCR